jgi:hypothetical protein
LEWGLLITKRVWPKPPRNAISRFGHSIRISCEGQSDLSTKHTKHTKRISDDGTHLPDGSVRSYPSGDFIRAIRVMSDVVALGTCAN